MTFSRRVLTAALLIAGFLLTGCGSATTVDAPPTAGQGSTMPSAVPESGRAKAEPGSSGLPTVALADLPPQAQQTYALIVAGGPYPYRQDGQIFGNREGLLPWGDYGWYREYTVETPGSTDRGARRFVVSEDRLFYYTDDHYDTFREVIR